MQKLASQPILIPTINTTPASYTPPPTSPRTPRPKSSAGKSLESSQLELHQTFRSQLTAGVSLILITSKKTRQQVKCYLLNSSHSVLCLIRRNGEMMMIDIGSADIMGSSTKYEVGWNLEGEEYMVVRENGHDYVFLFGDAEQNLWFQTNLHTMKSRAGILALDDNEEFGKALSLFRKYSSKFGDTEGISILDFHVIVRILNYHNLKKTAHILMLIMNNQQREVLTFNQFLTYLRLYYCKFDCYSIFQRYCKLAPAFDPQRPSLKLLKQIMTTSEFKAFLLSEQQQSEQDCNLYLKSMGNESISYYQFCRYIFSKDNYVYKQKTSDNQTKYPLNYYYCFSSHNTYLVGNQLTSKSKAKRYVQDLEKGYRCIQLDVHDSSEGPIINHKLTLTSSMLFEDAVKAISKFSNSTVHTPIILSIEIHCRPQGRHETASILMKYFGDKILVVGKDSTTYPKLSKLLNRIIVKGHVPIEQMMLYPNPIVQYELLRSITGLYKESTKQQFNICLTYRSMSFGDLKSKIRAEMEGILEMTSKGWMRVYPNGTNFFSQNDSPILAMEMGVQMIAINSQHNDVWKLILQTYFEENDKISSGYALKPTHLLEGKRVVATPYKVIVQVISANNIRFTDSSFSYHVKMAFFGSQDDNVFGNNYEMFLDVTERTSGEEGVFANSMPIAYTVKQPCFAFIVFQLTNYGRAAVAVKSLRKGYHSVRLLNQSLEPITHSSLLLKVSFSC